MRLYLAPLFIVCPFVGGVIGANSALASGPARNDSYFGDLTALNQFFGSIFGAISGSFLGFVFAFFIWAIVLALSDAARYDEFSPTQASSGRLPKAVYVLRWPTVFLSFVLLVPWLGAQILRQAISNSSKPSRPIALLPTPAPTFAAVLPEQEARTRRAQWEVPPLLGNWYYPGAQIWPCSQPRPEVPHSMIMLLTKDTLSTVIAYYASKVASLSKVEVPTRFVGRAPRPGDGRDTFVSVNQRDEFVTIQFSTS